MASIEKQINLAQERLDNMQHALKIAEAMAPDPGEWEYWGECEEGDPKKTRCACGHPIRWIFPIHRPRDGRTIMIGSVCIEKTVPALIEAGAERLARALQLAHADLEKHLAELARREREAQANEKCEILRAHAEALDSWYKELEERVRSSRRRFWFPAYFYKREYRCLFAAPLSTPGRTAASLARKIRTFHEEADRLRRWMYDEGIPGLWSDPPAIPVIAKTDKAGGGD